MTSVNELAINSLNRILTHMVKCRTVCCELCENGWTNQDEVGMPSHLGPENVYITWECR